MVEHMAATASDGPTERAVRRLARRLAPATVEEWALVVRADRLGRGSLVSRAEEVDGWLGIAKDIGADKAPVRRILTGDHLIAAGWEPGPQFKVVRDAAERAQDDGEFSDQAGAVAWFERNYGPAGWDGPAVAAHPAVER